MEWDWHALKCIVFRWTLKFATLLCLSHLSKRSVKTLKKLVEIIVAHFTTSCITHKSLTWLVWLMKRQNDTLSKRVTPPPRDIKFISRGLSGGRVCATNNAKGDTCELQNLFLLHMSVMYSPQSFSPINISKELTHNKITRWLCWLSWQTTTSGGAW